MDNFVETLCWLIERGLAYVWSFVWHVLPAATGVLLGGVLVNRFFVRKANVAAIVDRCCNRLDELRDFCAAYWTNAPEEDKTAILEAKIKAATIHVHALVRILGRKYGPIPDDVRESVVELNDLCTGGAFESRDRKPDKAQFLRIARGIDRVAVGLQELKL